MKRPLLLICITVAGIATASFWTSAAAQSGDYSPTIPDHRIWFFFGADTLKIPYERNVELGESHPGYDRAVVMVHGTGRTVSSYFRTLELAAEAADNAGDHSILIAPQFLIKADLDSVAPHDADILLYWQNSGTHCWKTGYPSDSTGAYPRDHAISSFAVMDSILYRLATRNPDLETIVVAGHSAGGQYVNRYAASNRMEKQLKATHPGIAIRYVVANPSSYLYFDPQRRVPGTLDEFCVHDSTSHCYYFNHYKYGLTGKNEYLVAAGGNDSLRAMFDRREVHFLAGEWDTVTAATDPHFDDSCQAMLQGSTRRERARTYYNYLVHLGWNTYGDNRLAIVPTAEHSARQMYTSACGVYKLFDYGQCTTHSPVLLYPGATDPRIQEVLNVVPEGTTLLLTDGTYKGLSNREVDFLGKVVSVRSLSGDPQAVVVDCENAGRGFTFKHGESPETHLKDLTIRNGYKAQNGGGISCYFEARPTIRNVIVEDCDAGESGGAMAVGWSAEPTIVNCTFHDNGALIHGGGIYSHYYARLTLLNTIISGSRTQEALWSAGGSRPALVRHCNFYDNEGGNWVSGMEDSLGVNGNIEADPLYCGADTDLGLCADSPCLLARGACPPQWIGALGQECDSCDTYVCCAAGQCYLFTSHDDCDAIGGSWHPEWQTCSPDSCPAAEGACCLANAVCQVMPADSCSAHYGFYQGDLTTCTPNPCPAACCVDSTCTLVAEYLCGGTWYADVHYCDPNPCLIRACCHGDTCSLSTEHDCTGTWLVSASSCGPPNPCEGPPEAVCCFTTGQCMILTEEQCTVIYEGTWYPGWGSCDPNPCTLAPCCVDGACTMTMESACAGDWRPDLFNCDYNPCETAPCCVGDDCTITIEEDCQALGGVWHEDWDSCDGNPCRQRACCVNGHCTVTFEQECAGVWHEDQLTCDPNPCPAVCCVGGHCDITTSAACDQLDGEWYVDLTTCSPNPCPAVCCHGSGSCDVVTLAQCDAWSGLWHIDGLSCEPNPCFHIIRPDTTGGWPTLAAAIQAANHNEVVALTNGVFDMSIHRGGQMGGVKLFGKRITVMSLSGNPGLCILECGGNDRAFHFAHSEGTQTVLKGVTIRNGSAAQGGAILLGDQQTGPASPYIYGCWFEANQAVQDGGAICGTFGSNPFLSGCVFRANTAGGRGGALCCGLDDGIGGGAEGNSCTFCANEAPQGSAIYVADSNNVWMTWVLIAFGRGGDAVECHPLAIAPSFSCSDLYGNEGGDWVGCLQGQLGTNNNISEDPYFCDLPDNLALCSDSPCLPENSPCGHLIGALGAGYGCCMPSGDLTGGALIVHAVPEVSYTTGTDWCDDYYEAYAITSCEEQSNRLDPIDSMPATWYVVAAWDEAQEWGSVVFGLDDYNTDLFGFDAFGGCFPEASGMELPTSGWPAPNTGVAIGVTDSLWSGNFVPIYYFHGYAYGGSGSGVIALDEHPELEQAGFSACDLPFVPPDVLLPQRMTPAEHLGGLGIGCAGIYCCPIPTPPAACCVGGDCSVVTPATCATLGGTWHAEWETCDPNPCPAVCCTEDGTCLLLTHAGCDNLGADWYPTWIGCDPSPCPGACCADTACTVTTLEACTTAGGAWHSELQTCDPNPCSAVCCIDEGCALLSEGACLAAGGTWLPDLGACTPNPCLTPLDWANHDVGNCVLTVTDRGTVGFMDDTQAQGSGFVYPYGSENVLFLGSLWVGESESYIANWDYSADPAKEWVVASNPDGHVWIDEGGFSHQDIHAAYTDSLAATPRGLRVDQESWAHTLNSAADDFVILRYTLTNLGAGTLEDLYAGLYLDFDAGVYYRNWAGTDETCSLAYVADSARTVFAGVRHLHNAGEPGLINVTLVPNETYVWPLSYVPDADKYGFLSAAPGYTLAASDSADDYSVLVSAGPITLPPSEEALISFAVVGGASLAQLQSHAGAAQTLYELGFADVRPARGPIGQLLLRPCAPNPFRDHTVIRFELPNDAPLRLDIFDVSGRLVRNLARGEFTAQRYLLMWDGRNGGGRPVAAGVYLMRLVAGDACETRRVVRIR